MAGIEPPTPTLIEKISARFAAAGFDPQVGS
jgi:hypothetical protein